MRFFASIFFSISLFTVLSCSAGQNNDAYLMDANNYCNVHQIDFWQKEGQLEALNQLSGVEKQAELSRVIRQSVKTPEMQELIFEKGGKLPAEDFYPFLQKSIPKLTGVPFDCPAIPEFYIAE